MNRLIRITLFFTVFQLPIGLVSAEATTKPQVICSDSAGKLVMRTKCRSTERTFSVGMLPLEASSAAAGPTGPAGPQGFQGVQGGKGPQGMTGATGPAGIKGVIDFSACRAANESLDTNFLEEEPRETLVGTVTCNSTTEFLFDYGFEIGTFPSSVGTKAYLQAVQFTNSNGQDNNPLPYKVDLTVNQAVGAGTAYFFVDPSGICCPR